MLCKEVVNETYVIKLPQLYGRRGIDELNIWISGPSFKDKFLRQSIKYNTCVCNSHLITKLTR